MVGSTKRNVGISWGKIDKILRKIQVKFCQLQRLIAQQTLKGANIKTTTNLQVAWTGFIIGTTDYEELLSLCRQNKPELSHATSETSFTLKDGKKVAKKGPNNFIDYIRQGSKFYGELVEIFQVSLGWDGVLFKIVHYDS
ncbi:hypothetical protein VP01_7784g1 [Puccinia sorghi]|uniref:Uncharacterized protein n=1 Tax=Puccinia sorghi TaxID=27349 RepID=A0A0L6UB93_9BASI|nr:hypothetical protein VP01_7784g1 [Puccinia sorghi]